MTPPTQAIEQLKNTRTTCPFDGRGIGLLFFDELKITTIDRWYFTVSLQSMRKAREHPVGEQKMRLRIMDQTWKRCISNHDAVRWIRCIGIFMLGALASGFLISPISAFFRGYALLYIFESFWILQQVIQVILKKYINKKNRLFPSDYFTDKQSLIYIEKSGVLQGRYIFLVLNQIKITLIQFIKKIYYNKGLTVAYMRRFIHHFSTYQKVFDQSIANPVEYWGKEAKELSWFKFPQTILDDSHPPFYRWYKDGKTNISYNLLDRNLEKNLGKQIAYHVESPITGKSSDITIEELHRRVDKFANSLVKDFGVKPGDTVIIYMPMIIESIIAKFACARIGAIHSVVFGGFAAPELALRIKDCHPKLIICATAGKQPNKIIDYEHIIADAVKISHIPDIPIIIFQREFKKRTHTGSNFHDFLQVQNAGSTQPPAQLDSNHPLYILYTSGTTGSPKGIYRDHGGTSVVLNHALKHIFNLSQGDGLFCTSDIGWVLGHSFITYGPLLRGIRSILFEGKPVGTPDAGVFWRIIQKHKIKHLYTSPTAIRGIRKEDHDGKLISPELVKSLEGVTLVGERCDVQTFKWVQEHLKGKFVNDTYWQTESGGPMLSNYLGLSSHPSKPGSACKPVPGYNLQVVHPETKEKVKPGQTGIVVMKEPTPPSFMLSLWQKDEAFVQKYFTNVKGFYETGDSGFYDEDGYFYIMSRVDDIINTAGHRLSTGEMEEYLMMHQHVAEAIVVGVFDEIKGEVPVGFVTVKSGHKVDPKVLQKQLVAFIREEIGPVASFKICHVVEKLPKTRTGKYLRNIVRKMYNKQKYQLPSTIDDHSVADDLQKFINKVHAEQKHQ